MAARKTPPSAVLDPSGNPAKTREGSKLGGKVRELRRRAGQSQAQLATALGISASYLNLIESNRRPLPATLLLRMAELLDVDLATFTRDDDARLVSELMEVFADPLFDGHGLTSTDVREMAQSSPQAARAVQALYRAYEGARESADNLASRLSDGEELATATGGSQPQLDEGRALGPSSRYGDNSRLPSEEVSDVIQRQKNHVPVLEELAEGLWREAKLNGDELLAGLARHLDRRYGVRVAVAAWGAEPGVLRRYDPRSRVLTLSELLPTRSRKFQLAHQIGLLEAREEIDRLLEHEPLTTDDSRRLARVALASYFAGAVLMPYGPFLQAAKEARYDIDVVGRRFRAGFEQVCHRLTTLRRSGAEGVPFHMMRIDVAGNISKRFSASGIRFARFSGACPRWNVFASFMTPGMIRIQISRMPDGDTFFCIARTIQKDAGGYHTQHPVQAIGLGCKVEHARELVYSDGVDLENLELAIPVGVTCRLCERADCEQRALPSLRHPLRVDENVRSVSLYAMREPLE